MDIKAHLKALCEAHAPSGYESAVREVILAAWQPLTDAQEVSRMGSLVAYKHGGGAPPRRNGMVWAHKEVIGLIVRPFVGAFLR
ncbi:MAG: M42 family peptidase, partial [Aggregatilineales bacterium]